MKRISWKTSILSLLALFTAQFAIGQELKIEKTLLDESKLESCALITFGLRDDMKLFVTHVDRKPLYLNHKGMLTLLKQDTFKISPGNTTFFGFAFESEGGKDSLKRNRLARQSKNLAVFNLDLKANVHYSFFTDKPDSKDEFANVTVEEKAIDSCPQEEDFKEIGVTRNSIDDRLPPSLKLEIHNVLAGLQNTSSASNVVPAGYSRELGFTISEQKSANASGLVISTVTPFSPSSRMGIKTADELLLVNGTKLTGTVEEKKNKLAKTFASIAEGEEYNISLKRNGQNSELSGHIDFRFTPLFGYSVQSEEEFAISNITQVSHHQLVQLELVVEKIRQSYLKLGIDSGQAQIYFAERVDERLGVVGKRVDSSGKALIEVLAIEEHSPASKLSLQVGDLIEYYNYQPLRPVTNEYAFELKLIRHGELIEINKSIHLPTLPKARLFVDLESKDRYITRQTIDEYLSVLVACGNCRPDRWTGIDIMGNLSRMYELYNESHLPSPLEKYGTRNIRSHNTSRAQVSVNNNNSRATTSSSSTSKRSTSKTRSIYK